MNDYDWETQLKYNSKRVDAGMPLTIPLAVLAKRGFKRRFYQREYYKANSKKIPTKRNGG